MTHATFASFALLFFLAVSAAAASGQTSPVGNQAAATDGSTEVAVLEERMNTMRVENQAAIGRIEAMIAADAASRRVEAAERRGDLAEYRTEMAEFATEAARRENRIMLFIVGLFAIYPFYLGMLRRIVPKLLP